MDVFASRSLTSKSDCVKTAPVWDNDTINCICQWDVTVPKTLSFRCVVFMVLFLNLGWSS